MIKFLNNNKEFRRFVIGNWISVATIFGIYICILVIACGFYAKIHAFILFYTITLVSFDANMVYAIRIIMLLKSKIILWNNEAVNSGNNHSDGQKFQILYHTVETFSHALIHIQIVIEICKLSLVQLDINGDHESAIKAYSIFTWLLKNLALQMILSSYCESFYVAINRAQDSSAIFLSTNCSKAKRRLCRNIQRIHKTSFSKLSACGLFYIDARLPRLLMGLLTNYTIVLLQFAFLSSD
ncbi:uncharacterized protein LOC142982817 [Anticarsia gemmatalis]|uniref:uncharacterized protein LOC142982817 n=1 Tax=Anticarsia gemmatalis TaxID=129554 RepID=UPI003F771759